MNIVAKERFSELVNECFGLLSHYGYRDLGILNISKRSQLLWKIYFKGLKNDRLFRIKLEINPLMLESKNFNPILLNYLIMLRRAVE